MSEMQPFASQSSPFDAIRRVRPDGTEYWSARDLMAPSGYPRWADFLPVIERAKTAAANVDANVPEIFRVAPDNPSELGGRPSMDYHLSRFACYLVAMNGDPRKSEVAAMQAYFAVRAREAEIKATLTIEGLKDLLADLYRTEHRDELAARGHREHIVSACGAVLSLHGHGKPEKSMRAFVQLTIDLNFGSGDTKEIAA